MIIRQDLLKEFLKILSSDKALEELVKSVLSVGDLLSDARREHNDIRKIIEQINSSDAGFTLKHKEGAAKKSPIRHSKIRTKLGVPETENASVLSRDSIKIKMFKNNPVNVCFDAAANYKDGNHNWGVHANIENDQGETTEAAIYMPETGQIYIANKEGAYYVSFPQARSIHQDIKISKTKIGDLNPKFNAEVGSWHTKERAFVKTLFTMLLREEVGGSLRETGMKEAPFAWVGLGRLGYAFIGNLKDTDGKSGSFIAEKSGASIMRIPLTSDSQNRSVVFAIHPKIAKTVLAYFAQAIKKAQGDVTIGNPTLIRNFPNKLSI